MNNQEFFDKTVAHLRQQGEAALSEGFSCRYRIGASDGRTLMCAVGVHIPDNVYTFDFEGQPIDLLMEGSEEIRELFAGVDHWLLRSMQDAHDEHLRKLGLDGFERAAENIAIFHGLIYTPPKGA